VAAKMTFSSIALQTPWEYSYFWEPNGFSAFDLSSYQISPLTLTPDTASLNPFATTATGISISAFSPPAGVDTSLLQGKPNIGGLISTHTAFSQTYGYFEMTAKLPATPGAISAFWLAPTSGQWPPELDVFEFRGADPTTMLMTVHSADGTIPMVASVPDVSAAYHKYAVDWEPNTITWYFDGTKVAQVATPSDMNQPMYLLADEESGTPDSAVGAPAATFKATIDIKSISAWSSNPYSESAANVNADATVATATGMQFIYSQDHHSSEIPDFNVLTDSLKFTNTAQTFPTISITAAGTDGHAIIESDANIINLPGVMPTQLTTANVLFSIGPN
jgi:beta-glucanase (GH16 family)